MKSSVRKYQEYSNNPEGLKSLDPAQLRAIWADLFKKQRPPQSNDLIMHKIAYFLQERDRDDLSAQMLDRLNSLAENPLIYTGNKSSHENNYKFIREWNGKKHIVTIISKNEFLYEGKPYKTLSAIACKITGAHWSGPLFFGLRKQISDKKR